MVCVVGIIDARMAGFFAFTSTSTIALGYRIGSSFSWAGRSTLGAEVTGRRLGYRLVLHLVGASQRLDWGRGGHFISRGDVSCCAILNFN